jgi:hypothetical protein
MKADRSGNAHAILRFERKEAIGRRTPIVQASLRAKSGVSGDGVLWGRFGSTAEPRVPASRLRVVVRQAARAGILPTQSDSPRCETVI